MTKKDKLSLIKTTLNTIYDYMDLIDGIPSKDPVLKAEKYLVAILEYYEQKGARLSTEHNKLISDAIELTTTSIAAGVKKHLKSIDNEGLYIEQVQAKTELNGGYYYVTSPIDNKTIIKIAKIPFLIWACGDTPYKHGQEIGDIIWDLKLKLIEMWGNTISCAGEKMQNDNEYHSEWIRSMGIVPFQFYNLVKEPSKKWINDFAFAFTSDFEEVLSDKDFKLEEFLNNLTNINIDMDEDYYMTLSLYSSKRYDKVKNKKEPLQSIPYNVNPNSSFPIYFQVLTEKEGTIKDFVKTTCVIVENSDESINEIALELCDYNNSIIFTRNASQTAHLINISKDLELNIFHLPSTVELSFYKIYKLEENGIITIITENNDFEFPGVSLKNCDTNKNWYKKDISKKVSNLSKCYNEGINVPNGFFVKGTKIPKIVNPIQMIARSAGSSENSVKASFSGIFKSKVLDIISIDNNYSKISEVINSFNSPVANKYANKMNIDLPKCSIFYQEYIKADKSFVAKLNNNHLYIESTNGSADGLVNGTAKEIEVFKYDNYKDINSIEIPLPLLKLMEMVSQISSILKSQILEFEIIMKDDILYLVQVV
jgi:hypothetical protein